METSEALIKWRKRKKLTQAQAAKLIGVQQPTVSGWEQGTRKVSLRLIDRVASVTKLSRKALRPDIYAPAR